MTYVIITYDVLDVMKYDVMKYDIMTCSRRIKQIREDWDTLTFYFARLCIIGCIEKLKNGLFNMPDSNFYGT